MIAKIHNRQTKMSISEKQYGIFYDKIFYKNESIKKENPKKEPSIGGIFADDINIAESS